MRTLLLVAACTCCGWPANAQLADTLLTWQTYGQPGEARVQVFAAFDDARPLTAVIDEIASNRGPLATDDARFLAETIGRTFGHDPADMTFVFRISGESFCERGSAARALLLRATFTRTRAGRLTTPNWRVITRNELAALTDRALY